ncbi:MAG: hypothetical protein ACTJFF_08585 [Moraxellaceae bacterium]
MSNSKNNMDKQEQEIKNLADDINPREDATPDSLGEATTVPLDNELGDNATEDDLKK